MHFSIRDYWQNESITLAISLSKHWQSRNFMTSDLICNIRTRHTLYQVLYKLTLLVVAQLNLSRRTEYCSLCACTTLTLLAEQFLKTCRVRACKALHIVSQKFGSMFDVLSCDNIKRCSRLFIGHSPGRRSRQEEDASTSPGRKSRQEHKHVHRLRCLLTQYVSTL
jgi:hypothetical protein